MTKPTRPRFTAAYRRLAETGELAARAAEARRQMEDCVLCARHCHVDRILGSEGASCRTGANAVVHSYGPHHGEERCLSGWAGSGTIFVAWCDLRCLYCQNWELSWQGEGDEVSAAELATMMLKLQTSGCHNINLVNPSHVIAPLLSALEIAAAHGLDLPLVYNSSGYDSLEGLALLDGVVDIYMPDMKYGSNEPAALYSRAPDYVSVNRSAVKEMHRQVGDLVLDDDGIAQRGLVIRHLVLPNGLAGSESVLRFIADEISPRTYVNIMSQYRPCHRAPSIPALARRLMPEEYDEARNIARRFGLKRLDPRPPTFSER
jgi:putative pyruvate formate lyase activating enzyme